MIAVNYIVLWIYAFPIIIIPLGKFYLISMINIYVEIMNVGKSNKLSCKIQIKVCLLDLDIDEWWNTNLILQSEEMYEECINMVSQKSEKRCRQRKVFNCVFVSIVFVDPLNLWYFSLQETCVVWLCKTLNDVISSWQFSQ